MQANVRRRIDRRKKENEGCGDSKVGEVFHVLQSCVTTKFCETLYRAAAFWKSEAV